MGVSPRASAALRAGRPRSQGVKSTIVSDSPVIPAKAGIQRVEAKIAARNQGRIAVDKSLPPLWGKARMGVSPRASAALRAGRPRSQGVKSTIVSDSPVIPAKAGIQRGYGDAIAEDDCARLSESGFSGFAGFSGFRFTRLPLFTITAIPAEANGYDRLAVEDDATKESWKIL